MHIEANTMAPAFENRKELCESAGKKTGARLRSVLLTRASRPGLTGRLLRVHKGYSKV